MVSSLLLLYHRYSYGRVGPGHFIIIITIVMAEFGMVISLLLFYRRYCYGRVWHGHFIIIILSSLFLWESWAGSFHNYYFFITIGMAEFGL